MEPNYFDKYDQPSPVGQEATPLPEEEPAEAEGKQGSGGIVADIAQGAINGLIGAGHSVSDLMADAGNAVIGGIENLTGSEIELELKAPEPFKFETGTAGKIAEGVSQFTVGFASGGHALRAAGWAAGGTKTVAAARAMTAGAIADFTMFQEDEERLSNLVQEFPALRNPVTEFLAADPDDHWAVGRLKNTLEGAGLGLAADAVAVALRGLKKAKVLEAAGDTSGAEKAIQESREEVAKTIEPPGPPLKANIEPQKDSLQPASRFTPEETAEIHRRIATDAGDMDAVSDAFNVKKWESTESGVKALNEYVKELRVKEPEAFSEVQTLETVQKLADDLLLNPDELRAAIAQRAADADSLPAEIVALHVRTIAAADALPKLARELESLRTAGDEAGAAKLLGDINKAEAAFVEDFVNLKTLQKAAARATGAGRIVKESRADIENVTDPEQLLKLLDDFEGDRDGFYKHIAKMNQNPRGVRKAFSMVFRNKMWDIANEFWINSILSGPFTQAINVASAALETGIKPVEGYIAAMIRGNPQAAKTELGMYAGMRHSYMDSFRVAKQALIEERNILDPHSSIDDRTNLRAINTRINTRGMPTEDEDWLIDIGKAIRLPSRFLAGGDEFFKQINYRARLYSEGIAAGTEKGLSGSELENFAKLNVEKGFDKKTGAALNEKAKRYAQEATFTEELEYGIGKSLQDLNSKTPAFRQILPFVRTPTNLYRHTIRRTPMFFMDQQARMDIMGKNGVKAQSEQYAKLATGSVMITGAAFLAAEGRIEGAAPKNPDLRRQFYDSGRKEYSFKGPNGKYYSFSRLDPRFAVFGIVADITKHVNELPEEDQSLATWLPIVALSFTNNLSSKSYLRGLSETLEVLTSDDPAAWDRYFNRQIGSRVVPFSSLLRTVNPDKELKELRSVTDGILANVPGLSDLVEPRRNVLGQPMIAGNPFVSEKTSSVVREELNFLGEEFGLPPKRFPQTRVDLTKYRKEGEFGQTAYDRYQELAGSLKINGKTMEQTLEDLIKSPVYQSFPALETEPSFRSKRAGLISSRIMTYRNLAMRQLRKEYPEMDQDIRTDQRNAKVAPVKGTSAIQGILQEAQ